MEKKKRVLVLGGGLAGLSAAWVLLKQGFQVEIIEKESHLGGLAITKSDSQGYSWDLGPHNIHTNKKHIVDFFHRKFADIFTHDVPCRIFKNGKFIDYPIVGAKVITTLPFLSLITASFTFLLARIRMFLFKPKSDDNFESWIKNRFGSVLFKEYFSEYPKKVWRTDTTAIDKYVAEKRIPVLQLLDILKSIFFGKKGKIDHPEWSTKSYYLKYGIGTVCKYFHEEIIKLGGKVSTESEVVKTFVSNKNASKITVKNTKTAIYQDLECDYLLSTIPINYFINTFDSKISTLNSAASSLSYVSSVLLFLKLGRENILPTKIVYFGSEDIPFSRIYDVGSFSASMVPAEKTLLCLEFPCTYGDKIWNSTAEELAVIAETHLKIAKILEKGDIESAFIEQIKHSYPCFKKGFKDNLKECKEFINSFENIISYGRQGGFSYVNTDQVINDGFKAANSVIISSSLGYTCGEWFEAAV
jgi:protoporphyrinogen oxidase